MRLQIYLISLLIILPIALVAQKENSSKDNFDHYGYMVDMSTYEELSKKDLSDIEICKNLGNTAFLNAKYEEASFWFAKLFTLNDTPIEPEYFYRYAQSLKSTKNYKESEVWMEKYRKANTNDIRASKHNVDENYIEELLAPSKQFTVENLSSINSKESDFAPSYFNDLLIFSTARDMETNSRTSMPYLNLYAALKPENGKYSTANEFSKELRSLANESSTSFSKDGKTVYFTRNNYKKGSFNRDKKGISRLKIYRATLEEGIWKNIHELPFNSETYSVAHPALNLEENKLYFSSDMPGTLGASDIYVVNIHPDGSFGKPVNLGPKVNTESRETFPFISSSGTLYFASDGHPGLGGLDIFTINLNNQDNVKNLGNPINSPNDDFSMIIDEESQSGYFASNRTGGVGSDDIYYLKTIDCMTKVSGIVVDKDSEKILANVDLKVLDSSGGIIGESKSDSEGLFDIEIPCQESQYSVIGVIDGYEEGSIVLFTSPEKNRIDNIRLELEETSKVAVVGADLVKVLQLDPIYFDLNSSYLREDAYINLDKVVDYMTKRPEVKVEIGSHTDSREEDNYNLWLSDRRAKRTVAYIISKGIGEERISGKGYGETQLINRCANGVVCSDKDHQLNRRSEFIIVK